MGYYMRFIVEDEEEISFEKLEAALKIIDPDYSIDFEDSEGILLYKDEEFAQMEINTKKDEFFEDDILMLLENLEEATGENKQKVTDVLKKAQAFFFVRVLWGGRDNEVTLSRIDPLWSWFFENYRGLLQADSEGYYDASDLIFEVK